MEPVAFDSLRYSRRLAEVGVPKPQAELQAEVMAEAFGYYTREIVTREYLQTTLRAEFAEQNTRLEQSLLLKATVWTNHCTCTAGRQHAEGASSPYLRGV